MDFATLINLLKVVTYVLLSHPKQLRLPLLVSMFFAACPGFCIFNTRPFTGEPRFFIETL